jgi:diguanylate cyclase (GGDEF)-like protein
MNKLSFDPESVDLGSTVTAPQRLAAVAATGLLDTPPEEAFDRVTRLAARVLAVPVTFLSLVDRGRDFYKSQFGFGEPLASSRQLEGLTFCHYAIVSDGPLVLDDTTSDAVFREVPTVASLGVRAYAGIPLRSPDGQALGSFCAIDFQPKRWSAGDIEVLAELAQSALREIHLRMAVERTLQVNEELRAANEQLRALATTDALTGLKNRHHFEQSLEANIDLLARSASPLSLLLIDADHFKRINDTLGHPVGDKALQTIARVLEANCRKTDVLARYGGEEFAVILPNADYSGAICAAERFRAAVEREARMEIPLTVSVGAATAAPRSDGKTLLADADRALYASKRNGRNRVTHVQDMSAADPA